MLCNMEISFWIKIMVLFIFILTPTKAVIRQSMTIGLKYVKFFNPDGAVDDGRCCDNHARVPDCTPNKCNTKFRPCATFAGGTRCGAYYSTETAVTTGIDSFVFGPDIGNKGPKTRNSIKKHHKLNKEDVEFNILALEDSMSGVIGNFTFTIDWMDEFFSIPSRWKQFKLHDGNVTLTVKVFRSCFMGFFGPKCDVYCNDKLASSHFTCLEDGSKKCTEGWQGEDCNDLVPYCNVAGVCYNGGICINEYLNYTCECAPGYSGRNCEFDTRTTTDVVSTTIEERTELLTTKPETFDSTTTEQSLPDAVTIHLKVTTEPSLTEPVTHTATTTEPSLTEPVTHTATTTEPSLTEPVTHRATTTEPSLTEPVTHRTRTTEPSLTGPETDRATTTEPSPAESVIDRTTTTETRAMEPMSETTTETRKINDCLPPTTTKAAFTTEIARDPLLVEFTTRPGIKYEKTKPNTEYKLNLTTELITTADLPTAKTVYVTVPTLSKSLMIKTTRQPTTKLDTTELTTTEPAILETTTENNPASNEQGTTMATAGEQTTNWLFVPTTDKPTTTTSATIKSKVNKPNFDSSKSDSVTNTHFPKEIETTLMTTEPITEETNVTTRGITTKQYPTQKSAFNQTATTNDNLKQLTLDSSSTNKSNNNITISERFEPNSTAAIELDEIRTNQSDNEISWNLTNVTVIRDANTTRDISNSENTLEMQVSSANLGRNAIIAVSVTAAVVFVGGLIGIGLFLTYRQNREIKTSPITDSSDQDGNPLEEIKTSASMTSPISHKNDISSQKDEQDDETIEVLQA